MRDVGFNRHPSWSARTAIARIEARLATVAKRRDEIVQCRDRLAEEDSALEASAASLQAQLEIELQKVARRDARARILPREAEGTAPLSAPSTPSPVDAPVLEEDRYGFDRRLSLFTKGDVDRSASADPRPVALTAEWSSDPELVRLSAMLDVPGLVHAMVLHERAQLVIDVDAAVARVPEAAIGLARADRYAKHVFAVDAFSTLSEPSSSAPFLAVLTEPGIEPSSS